jgi:hypothetical protein
MLNISKLIRVTSHPPAKEIQSPLDEGASTERDLFNQKQYFTKENTTMTITSFNPLIVTKDAEGVIALFEALGFERRHMKTGINGSITSVRMRYEGEDGKVFHVDVTSAPVPQDISTIRMNVRDFDEAYKMLEDKGFVNAQGDKITETGTSKSTMMVSPSGFSISVSEHIRKED